MRHCQQLEMSKYCLQDRMEKLNHLHFEKIMWPSGITMCLTFCPIQLSTPFWQPHLFLLPSGNCPQEEKGCSQDSDSWWQKTPGLTEETGSEQHCRDRRGEPSKEH